jgi:hypothetical protein
MSTQKNKKELFGIDGGEVCAFSEIKKAGGGPAFWMVEL